MRRYPIFLLMLLGLLVGLAGCSSPSAEPAKNPQPASTEKGTKLSVPKP